MRRALVTGGAGFIGCNAARFLAAAGWRVVVLDTLCRRGSPANLEWLRGQVEVEHVAVDVRAAEGVARVIREGSFDAVLHLAGQVAVTTSLVDPRGDFEANALGTFNVLEAIRCHSPQTALLYASTNKVYGRMPELEVRAAGTRCELAERPAGIAESQPLDFHSPYGCSKGAADQYVLDSARIYGLRTVSLRQSCCYGPRQLGDEDQGWLAWFAIAHQLGRPITIYGDGRQVRDVLFVDDLVELYARAIESVDAVAGRALNIGGGPANTLSLLELLAMLEELTGRPVTHTFGPARPGDQPVFVSDISLARELLGWSPRIGPRDGVRSLLAWVSGNRELFGGK